MSDPAEIYRTVFPDEKSKADAFDKIAERFYRRNFGTMSKTDMEVLMFSIYLEQILAKGSENYSTYSDYTLSKDLGITQAKVSNLKVKKQLQYPIDYDWKKAITKLSERARYEKGKISIQIPDTITYNEIKNAIEEKGGFVEMTLNRTLLVVPLEYFLDFVEQVSDGEDREQLRKAIQDEFRKYQTDREIVEKEQLGTVLVDCGVDTVADMLADVADALPIPVSAGLKCISDLIRNVSQAIRKAT